MLELFSSVRFERRVSFEEQERWIRDGRKSKFRANPEKLGAGYTNRSVDTWAVLEVYLCLKN